MTYCPEIKTILDNANIIKISTEVYKDDVAKDKYRIIAIANRFTQKKTNLTEFNKKRCRPSFNDADLLVLNEQTDTQYKELLKFQEQSKEKPDVKIESEEEKRIKDKALEVLEKENIFEFFLKEYRKRHIGDEKVLELMLLTSVCPHVKNSFGIFPKPSGDKGSGKSSAIYASAGLIHPDWVLFSTFSGKALFYNDIREGMIIISDDITPSDDIIDLMKKKMSVEYHRESTHLTTTDQEGEKKTIPPGVTFILTSVTDSKSEQLIDRQWIIPHEKNKILDNNYSEFLLDKAEDGFKDFEVTTETKVCWEITKILKSTTFDVSIPFAKKIQFTDEAKENRRSENNFIDVIRCHAAIYHKRRKVVDGVIQATEEDFQYANTLMGLGEQHWNTKLSHMEEVVWNIIVEHPDICQNEIATLIKRGKTRVHQILFGENKDSSGLANKAPLIYEKLYDKNSGAYRTTWKAIGKLNKFATFATLKDDSKPKPLL